MFGPDGAEGCSHGWSSPRANGTRGLVTTRPSRPGGAEDGSPSPLRGEYNKRDSFPRVLRPAARNAPPVSTALDPFGVNRAE